jgi:signal transduction histidine kinase
MINLNDIIQSIQTDLETVIQKKKAVILSDSLPQIQGYATLIYQLFYNLISNSLKFSKAAVPPRIQIQYSQVIIDNKPFAEFRIIDNGIGFDSENAVKIFQSFARLNSREDYEGTGLGLSLCKKIADRHHGSIYAKAEAGIGAEFILQLPLRYSEL